MADWAPLHARFPTNILKAGLLCLLALCGPAWGGVIDCTPITSLPATITTQGIYCLNRNLRTFMNNGGYAIEIQANNVTIDLNGFFLGGLGIGNSGYGIYALNRKNITLRNGRIWGFIYGVFLRDSSIGDRSHGGHLLEDLRFERNTNTGLHVEGPGNLIRGNQVIDTGGYSSSAFGISADGPGTHIVDNEVDNTFSSTGAAYGIYFSATPAIIQGNRITETTSTGGGDAYGIYGIPTNIGVIYEANIISNTITIGRGGIFANGERSLCGNNRVRGFTTGIFYCVDAGGNFSL